LKTRNLIGVAIAMLTILAATANAALEEVIVTAQRRSQDIQRVPLAVSAFGMEQIEKLQINLTQDIGENVPNLQTYEITANGAAMQIHARGTSVQNPGSNTSESPVGIYEDDIYRGRMATANLDLTDVERIEVLRGPQATLYGRNTIAGAIKIITRTPEDDFYANGSVGYGKFETAKVTGAIGGPLKEGALAGSVAFSYHDRGEGDLGNPITGVAPGEFENKAARAKLHWYGTDSFDARLSVWTVDVENDGYNGVPYIPFPPDPAASPGSPIAGFYDNLDPEGINFGESEQSGVALHLDFQFGAMDLRSITGYTDIDDHFGFEPDFLTGLLINSESNTEQWSQEFQLLGTALNDRLNWITGLYFLNEEGEQAYNAAVPPVFAFTELTESDTSSYAAFGEATYQFLDKWSVTLGLRWTRDDKEWKYDCVGPNCSPTTGGDFSLDLEDDWDEWTPKLGLQYQMTDNWLTYLSIARGFQAGGFQTLCFGALQCAEQVYDPQDVWSYELGFKSELFEQTLRLNGAVFYAQYDDLQQAVVTLVVDGNGVPIPPFVTFPTQNIGDADVWGIELEAFWIPVDNLNVFGIFGFMDADEIRGLELPSTPDFTARVGFDYTVPVGSELDVFFGLDVIYTDDYFSEATNALLIDDYARFNGLLGIGSADARWQLVGTWKNLTNEEDNVSGLVIPDSTNTRTVLPPLEYMITLSFNY